MTERRSHPQAAAEALASVDRAIAELRRGGLIVITALPARPQLAMAGESGRDEVLERLRRLAGGAPELVMAGRRAVALGAGGADAHRSAIVAVPLPRRLGAEAIARLVDPAQDDDGTPVEDRPDDAPRAMASGSPAAMALELAKHAALLPGAVVAPPPETAGPDIEPWAVATGIPTVSRDDILTYAERAAFALRRVGEAAVPLADAEDARIIAFRPSDGGFEHLAIVVGGPPAHLPILTRVHSQCFTGDLLGSLRCDCGDQLRGALGEIAAAGGGVLLYLPQEGRGIGLVNKLRAYELQDRGLDTVDANEQLGFADDERLYLAAAEMLRQLGYGRVRLMTNNPAKVEALRQCGVQVVERVPHVFPSNDHSARYLQTKAVRGGHLL